MEQHFVYLQDLNSRGILQLAGPVLDPKGVYGVGVIRAASPEEARDLVDADPSVQAGLQRVEIAEMRVAFPPSAR